MGADYYEVDSNRTLISCNGNIMRTYHSFCFVQTENDKNVLSETGGIPIGIGKNSHIRKAIIDKNARIGENVKVFQIY